MTGTIKPFSVPTATPTLIAAFQDGDSASSPAVNVTFSPSGSSSLTYTSDVSTPEGDAEDWVQFTPYGDSVSFGLDCSGNGTLKVELWQAGSPLSGWGYLTCGETQVIKVTPSQPYLIRLQAVASGSGLAFIHFTLKVATVR